MRLRLQTPFIWILLVIIALVAISPVWGQGGDDGLTPQLEEDISAVETQVDELRELTLKNDIARDLVLDDELLALVENDVVENYTAEDAREDVLFYSSFGFMPADTDLLALTLDVLGEQVVGFYDTDKDTMYVLSAEGDLDALSSIIYAHEYLHALQDANFNLDDLIDEDRNDTAPDLDLAILSVVEGDAQMMTVLYTQWLVTNEPLKSLELLGQITEVDSSVLESAPAIIQHELTFPYEQGLVFIQTLYNEAGWRLVNEVYARPPLSTEQILHPSLYLLYEEPVEVEVAPLDDFFADNGDEEWQLVRDHAIGEFYIREHLRLFVDQEQASTGAAGWGGDRVLLYANADDETIVVWRLAWDTPTDGDEFNSIYADFATAWTGASPQALENESTCWQGFSFAVCETEIDGETLVVRAPQIETASAILDYEVNAKPETEDGGLFD